MVKTVKSHGLALYIDHKKLQFPSIKLACLFPTSFFRHHYLLLHLHHYHQNQNQKKNIKMPCLYISTNVNLDGIDTDPIFSEATSAVSAIIGKPQKYVMVILKGSVAISFEGNKEPAAYAEIVSMGGIDSQVKKKLIASIGSILHSKLSIPPSRFFLKVFDTTLFRHKNNPSSKL